MSQLFPVAAICPTVRQLAQQPVQAPVLHAVTLLAGVVTQCTANVGFTAATGAGDQQVLATEHPFILAQLRDTRTFQVSGW